MKRNTYFYCFLLLVLLVTSTGCQPLVQISATPTGLSVPLQVFVPPPPTATATPIIQTINGIPLGANLDCPDRAAFGFLKENVPSGDTIVNNPILFRWYYWPAGGAPADWSTVCVPTSFVLNLSDGPDHTSVFSIPVLNPTVEDKPNYLLYSFHLSDDLASHTIYRWIITGYADGIEIDQEQLPLLYEDAPWKKIMNSIEMNGQFQTGPMCDALNITPANLISPPNGAVLENDTPVFKWSMPYCAGKAFLLAFDTDPQMTSIDFSWALKVGNFLISPGKLQPCTQYYWQVKTGLNSVDYHISQGNWSTTSEIRSFSIRSLACPNGRVEPTLIPTSTFKPWTPTPTATLVPVKPTNPPVNCSDYGTSGECWDHKECEWYDPGAAGEAYCRAAP